MMIAISGRMLTESTRSPAMEIGAQNCCYRSVGEVGLLTGTARRDGKDGEGPAVGAIA
jgi:hypothetical protein